MKWFIQHWVHIVWSTHTRRPLMRMKYRKEIFGYIWKLAKEKGYYVAIVNGAPDHLHLLVSLKPTQCISKFVKDVKGASSRWFNEEGWHLLYLEDGCRKHNLCAPPSQRDFAWQQGYAAFSVNPAGVSKVFHYIKNQDKRHAEQSFKEEMEYMKRMVMLNLNSPEITSEE